MSALDATFLDVEDGTSHMHIGSCAIFAGPAPSMQELTALVSAKLHLVERFRQKVKFVPRGLGRPVWVDDARFDLGYHLRRSALPRPGGGQQLDDLMGRLMSQELDRDRPLWEMWLVEGLAHRRWALITKVHHCMVDGVSGTDLMAMMLETSPAARPNDAKPWVPDAEPSDVHLIVDALAQSVVGPARQLLSWTQTAGHPRAALSRLGETVSGLRSFASRITAPTASLSIARDGLGSIGRHRRWAVARCSLADTKTIRTAFGGSVNDVVLAAITSAFRELLQQRGDPVIDVGFTALVPVSVRSGDDHSFNNQVSMMLLDLPVDVSDPLDRLDAVRTRMDALKCSHQASAGAVVVDLAGQMPPVLLSLGVRAAMSIMHRTPQHAINTVTTNVAGPPFPLYAMGRELLEYLPFVPLSYGLRLGIAILSYNGQLSFGITGDYESAPDLHTMATAIVGAMNELRDLAARTATTGTRRV